MKLTKLFKNYKHHIWATDPNTRWKLTTRDRSIRYSENFSLTISALRQINALHLSALFKQRTIHKLRHFRKPKYYLIKSRFEFTNQIQISNSSKLYSHSFPYLRSGQLGTQNVNTLVKCITF